MLETGKIDAAAHDAALEAPIESPHARARDRARCTLRRRDGARGHVATLRRGRVARRLSRLHDHRQPAAGRGRRGDAAGDPRVRPPSRLSRAARDPRRGTTRRTDAGRRGAAPHPRRGPLVSAVVRVHERDGRRRAAGDRPTVDVRCSTTCSGRGGLAGRSPRSRAQERGRRADRGPGRLYRAARRGRLASGATAGRRRRAGCARSERRLDRRAHRWLRFLGQQVQPGAAGAPAARLGVQAVPVLGGARERLHARRRWSTMPRS